MLKRRLFQFVKYGVSIGLLALILLRADLGSFADSLKEANALIFGVGLLVAAFNLVIRSYKWQILLRVHSAYIPLATVTRLNFMAMFFNNFFLGAIGGDVFRAYRAFGYSNTRGDAVTSIVVDRATGIIMGLFLPLALGVGFLLTSDLLISEVRERLSAGPYIANRKSASQVNSA